MKQAKHHGAMLKTPLHQWPQIDLNVLEGRVHKVTTARCEAVELYAQGYPQEHIFEQTGVSRQALSRLLHRCQCVATDGDIFGYRALVLGANIRGYTRKRAIKRVLGDQGAGCSGALGQLFARFGGLEKFIQSEYLRIKRTNKHENVRRNVEQLHECVIGWLEERGLTEDEWPLNTLNEGIETLRRYCKDLIRSHEQEYLAARYGTKALSNCCIGTGDAPVFKPRRPFGAVQLDFHKVDCACVISVTNPFGVEVLVPLARWHIGLIIEEHFEAILGAVIALEITPSADSVLETIETALLPIVTNRGGAALAIGAGAKVFVNQLLGGLVGQGFDVIRMDNGWSNIAIHVIDNIIDVIGAAVDFGPVRTWWTRPNIERIFGLMTRAALQCSPSTYGANVLDTRRDHPEKTAMALEIKLTDMVLALEKVISQHNQDRTAGLLMAAPYAALGVAMENSASLFMPAPITNPSSRDEGGHGVMMYKAFRAVIRGNRSKGVRPYIKIGGWRYTNRTIASDFSQIGNKVKVYCSLRDARIAYATNLTTSEDLGQVLPPAKWAQTHVSFRMRAILLNNGQRMRRKERRDAKTHQWLPTPDETRLPSAADALLLVKKIVDQGRENAAAPATESPEVWQAIPPVESQSTTTEVTTTQAVLSLPRRDGGGLFNLKATLPITRKD